MASRGAQKAIGHPDLRPVVVDMPTAALGSFEAAGARCNLHQSPLARPESNCKPLGEAFRLCSSVLQCQGFAVQHTKACRLTI